MTLTHKVEDLEARLAAVLARLAAIEDILQIPGA
jgi:hypothetical protein